MSTQLGSSDRTAVDLEYHNTQIADLTAQAQVKWQAFEQAREQYAHGGNVDTNSPGFKAAEAVHREYAAVQAEIKSWENSRDQVFRRIADGDAGPASGSPGEFRGKSLSERALGSLGYKQLQTSGALTSDHMRIGSVKLADLSMAETKTLVTGLSDTSAGAFVVNDQQGYVGQPIRPPSIIDLVTVGTTDSDTVEFARQTTWTNVAAETLEATATTTGTKPEATVAFEKVTAAVETIAHFLPATRRSLGDAGQLRTIVDNQLRQGLRLRLEDQIVNGNGTTPNLRGILNTSNILTQAKSTDSVADAVLKAIVQLRLGYIEPTAIGIHPTDWQLLALARDDSGTLAGTGSYLWSTGGGGPTTLWGLPLVVTPAIPDDTAIVGDWTQCVVWMREAASVLVTDSHSDWFTKNILAILAEMRATVGVLLPQAFAKVTGLD